MAHPSRGLHPGTGPFGTTLRWGWLPPRSRSATPRSVLAGAAAAEAAARGAARANREAQPCFPIAGDAKAAAFFDLDNTVMQGAAIFHFGRGLYKRKFFHRRDLLRFAWQQAWFRLAGVEDPEHMQDARDSALSIVKGHRVAELMSIGEEIYDEYMADKIWPGTRALAQAHLDAGQRVWLVTAAPVETATIIARRLGLTGALGTVAESVDGVYTGRLVGEPLHGPAKAEAVRALAAARGAGPVALRRVQRLANDIPMLSLVGHPYAINPDSALRKHARAPRAGGCATTAPAARRPASACPAAAGVGARGRAARPPPSPSQPPPPLTRDSPAARRPVLVVTPRPDVYGRPVPVAATPSRHAPRCCHTRRNKTITTSRDRQIDQLRSVDLSVINARK